MSVFIIFLWGILGEIRISGFKIVGCGMKENEKGNREK